MIRIKARLLKNININVKENRNKIFMFMYEGSIHYSKLKNINKTPRLINVIIYNE